MAPHQTDSLSEQELRGIVDAIPLIGRSIEGPADSGLKATDDRRLSED